MRPFTFNLFGVPVRVRGTFFFMLVLFGAARSNITLIVEWVVVAFVSVLAHEFGHAAMGRAFGLAPSIDLPEGGLAAGVTSFEGTSRARVTPFRSVMISLAGPGLGFVLGGIFMIVRAKFAAPNAIAAYALEDLIWVNCGWGVVNLIPALPLDGGNVLRTIVRANVRGADAGKSERIIRMVSMASMALAAIYALTAGWIFMAFMAAYLAFQNFTAMRAMPAPES